MKSAKDEICLLFISLDKLPSAWMREIFLPEGPGIIPAHTNYSGQLRLLGLGYAGKIQADKPLAIVALVAVHQLISVSWYSPYLFGYKWINASGFRFFWVVFLFQNLATHNPFAQRPVALTYIDGGRDRLIYLLSGLVISTLVIRKNT